MPGPLVAALKSRAHIAPGIVDLVFELRDPPRFAFKAGQFVSFAVVDATGAALPRRSYSIASQTTEDDRLRFIVRVIEGGAASDHLMGLEIGDEQSLTGPHGFFTLDAAHAGDVVFGATGTGMAAVMPMLGELAARPETGRRFVYWGARQESDLFARAEIEALAARAGATLSIHLTAPGPAWTGGRGRITAAILEALPGLASPTFYLVGNGAMITELKRELVARGVNRKAQIRTEAFFD
ncbi:MAG TPA: FAD-binding oxidoreductase [Polyangia bacterium]|nr:FAD-binding oxidoreductase [Polyangia bacterium]